MVKKININDYNRKYFFNIKCLRNLTDKQKKILNIYDRN